jgi:carbonic anhydrase
VNQLLIILNARPYSVSYDVCLEVVYQARRTNTMSSLDHLLARNKAWSEAITEREPDFFHRLAQQQTPEYLWIGCSDSRVSANQIVDLPPGEVFVHRNIANVVVHTDLNCLSVIQFAVEVLAVKHIIVCGHYGCSGVKAAVDDKELGLIDNWLRHIKDVARLNSAILEEVDPELRGDLLCELNVIEQVTNVCNTTIVKGAWNRGMDLSVHGCIYNIENGVLNELQAPISAV